MMMPKLLHSASTLLVAARFKSVRPALARLTLSQPCKSHSRFLSQFPSDKKSKQQSRNDESTLPEAPPTSNEEIEFLKDLVRSIENKSGHHAPIDAKGSELPEAPSSVTEWDLGIDYDIAHDEDEEEEEIEFVPYIPPRAKPPYLKMSSIPGENNAELMKLKPPTKAGELTSSTENCMAEPGSEPSADALRIDPSMMPILAAWARAVVPSHTDGPMPLHEIANKSTKIKKLVNLGVDFSKIVGRHGDMERLLHLSWENQIKPHIRFFTDIGVDPDQLGSQLTHNTALLWTSIDDMQVRINYLEAKQFTCDDIKKIVNRAPFWLTLPTKEVDIRLGFLQRTFQLQGSEVRFIAATFPKVISSPKWEVFVNTTKLMDREFGFDVSERKDLLFHKPQCYMRPGTLRMAFDYCHNQIGLTHTQLVKHATLLVNRVNHIKPRHQFLKFLKRDNFNVSELDYLSPDWLWKGTTEEFCKDAAKTTIEDYECFLKYSMY